MCENAEHAGSKCDTDSVTFACGVSASFNAPHTKFPRSAETCDMSHTKQNPVQSSGQVLDPLPIALTVDAGITILTATWLCFT